MGAKTGSTDTLQSNIQFVNEFKLLGIKFTSNLQNFSRINLETKIPEIEKLLLAYKRRNLSLLGRVTVIKSLAISKLIHIFSVIDTISTELLTKIEKLFQEFVWNGKKLRTQYCYATKSIEDGGLCLPNLKILIGALKLTWIKRSTLENGSWQKLFKLNFDDPNLIWNLDPQSILLISKTSKNQFWKCTLHEWCEYLKHDENINDIYTIKQFTLWNSYYLVNTNIIKKKEQFLRNGLVKIDDLFMLDKLLSLEQFRIRFHVNINYLDFETLKRSIPLTWVNKIIRNVDQTPGNIQTPLIKLLQASKTCKYICAHMVKKCVPTRTVHQEKWELILGHNLENSFWRETYIRSKYITIDTKLKSFYYRIVNRLLVTNRNLKLWNILDSDKCSFCGVQVETLEHLLSDCVYSRSIWFDLAEWLTPDINIYPLIKTEFIMLGVPLKLNFGKIINLLFLLTKRYLYVQRCFQNKINFSSLLIFLLKYRNI